MRDAARDGSQLWIAVACVLTVAAVFWQAELARGEPPTSVSVGVERLPESRLAIFRLTATAGEKGAAFGFEYELPPWPVRNLTGKRSLKGLLFGSPVRILTVDLAGPGSLSRAPGPVLKPVGRPSACYRNGSILTSIQNRYWVEVPAGSTTTVELLARGVYPYWPGTKYEISFSTFDENEAGAPLQPLQVLGTELLGPMGTFMRIRERKRGGEDFLGLRTPEIIGTTEPPFRHARIALRAVYLGSPPGSLNLAAWSARSAVRLGTVLTDGKGRFRLPPQALSASGDYGFLARSQARGARAADWNCGPFFTVGP